MSSEMARRIVARVLTAADIKVHNVEFASGQEPDEAIEMGEDFASLVRAEFTVSGRTLARLLGKQQRVLEKALDKATTKLIVNKLQDNRDMLRVLTPAVKRMVTQYITRDLGENAPSKLTVEFAEESDLPYTAKIDARKQSVRVELEFEVGGDY